METQQTSAQSSVKRPIVETEGKRLLPAVLTFQCCKIPSRSIINPFVLLKLNIEDHASCILSPASAGQDQITEAPCIS